MTQVLATYNIKGGVGKTSAAVNLAYLAARDHARTLLWDLDPQGASTYLFRVKPRVKGGGRKLVRGKSDIRQLIKGTDHDRLELLPADFSYRHMDLALDTAKRPTRRLAKVLAPLADEYDYIFLDCPPSISLVSESVFETADALLVPIIPATLSSRTFEQLQRLLDRELASGPQVLAFFSMVDWRKRLHRDVIARFDDHQANMLRTAIPAAADVENMGLHRTAIGEFAPSSRAALAYEALWRELRDRLQPTATWDAFTSASDDDELSHGDTRDGRRWRLPTLPARR
jgi:chromosome partitioning protein